jgi:hypothetical protein
VLVDHHKQRVSRMPWRPFFAASSRRSIPGLSTAFTTLRT